MLMIKFLLLPSLIGQNLHANTEGFCRHPAVSSSSTMHDWYNVSSSYPLVLIDKILVANCDFFSLDLKLWYNTMASLVAKLTIKYGVSSSDHPLYQHHNQQ